MEIRALKATDIAPLTRIISKVGIKNIMSEFTEADIKRLAKAMESKEDGETRAIIAGIDVVTKVAGVILEHYSSCQNELISFVANVTGTTFKDVSALGMDEFLNVVVDIIKRPEFVGFMKVVKRLIK